MADVTTAAAADFDAGLEGAHVRLRAINRGDYNFLYDLMKAPTTAFRGQMLAAQASPEQFANTFWNQVLVQFLAETKDGQPVGQCTIYEPDFRNGHAYLAMGVAEPYMRSGVALEAGGLLLTYAFTNFQFRKLYGEVPGYFYESFSSGAGRYFEVEGVQREHEFWAGRYWDRYVVAIYRSVWEEAGGRFELGARRRREALEQLRMSGELTGLPPAEEREVIAND